VHVIATLETFQKWLCAAERICHWYKNRVVCKYTQPPLSLHPTDVRNNAQRASSAFFEAMRINVGAATHSYRTIIVRQLLSALWLLQAPERVIFQPVKVRVASPYIMIQFSEQLHTAVMFNDSKWTYYLMHGYGDNVSKALNHALLVMRWH